MKTRFALMLMALLPLLAACKAQDGTANTAAPTEPATTEAPAATTPDTTAASGETAAAEQAAAEMQVETDLLGALISTYKMGA